MTTTTVTSLSPTRKLISFLPDTDLSRLTAEGYALSRAYPGILEMIDRDRDRYALRKKKVRLEDREWLISRGVALPGFDVRADEVWDGEIELSTGRPRMPAELVLIFILIRGYLGGFKDKKTAMLLLESKTLEIVLINMGLSLPGLSTILDNINSIDIETLEYIVDAQILQAGKEKLDSFEELTFDSTSVEANSAWPTDSGTITGLASRADHLLRSLTDLNIKVKLPAIVAKLITDMDILHKQIQLSAGKKDSVAKRKKLYRKLFKFARKVRQLLLAAQERAGIKADSLEILPSIKTRLAQRLEWIEVDLSNLDLAIQNGSDRVLRDVKVPAAQKILSLSDESAAMIVKGAREPVLGFKPQIARSGSGFVAAILVPEGNAADSAQMRAIVDMAIKRTGTMPTVLSFDDGYTNGDDRNHYLEVGVSVVSFSGSKGKRLIPAAEYDSDAYKKARLNRSAIESGIFTLKHNHDFDRVMRRGIDNVRSELLEKSIAHNFFQMIKLRDLQKIKKAA